MKVKYIDDCKSIYNVALKRHFHEIWEFFLMDIHWKSIVSRSTADIFKKLRVAIELFILKDAMWLM